MQKVAMWVIIVLTVASVTSARKRKVMLELDYTKKPAWNYALDYRSECVIMENDSTSRINTHVLCAMSARPNRRGDRMTFTMDTVTAKSDLFTEEQRQSILNKLSGAQFGIALIGGCPVVDTLSSFSVNELSEWDLVIQFARLLPYIPRQPVKKGYTWEESSVHPIATSMGTIPCEVLRVYKVDSLPENGALAYISWQFNYAVAQLAVDSSAILKKVPVSGKGNGTAVLDLTNKNLLRANVEFHTPVASMGNVKINWVENTTLSYKPSR